MQLQLQLQILQRILIYIIQMLDPRAAISVTDSGGDGSLAYNNTTGVITYTGPKCK